MGEGEILNYLLPNEKDQEDVKKWCEANDCAISCMFENRLEKADEMREKGNTFLNDGNFKDAEQHYYAAVFQLDFSMAQYGEEAKPYEDKINTRKIKVLSNMSLARFKHKKYVEAKEVADIGLRVCNVAKLDEETTKAAEAKFWYLTGQANMERGFSEDAVEALKKAQERQPNDVKIRQSLAQAVATKKEDTATAKTVWKQKLLTDDQKLSMGPWWQPSSIAAKIREHYRLKGCCGHRKKDKPETESQDTPSTCQSSSARPRYSSSSRGYSRRPRY
jgi:outer membrane protein assembly factor BamD (BamD/ComL family)